jgi:hypothetical protein
MLESGSDSEIYLIIFIISINECSFSLTIKLERLETIIPRRLDQKQQTQSNTNINPYINRLPLPLSH